MNVGQLVRQKRTGALGLVIQIERCPVAMQLIVHILIPTISGRPMMYPYYTNCWNAIDSQEKIS